MGTNGLTQIRTIRPGEIIKKLIKYMTLFLFTTDIITMKCNSAFLKSKTKTTIPPKELQVGKYEHLIL